MQTLISPVEQAWFRYLTTSQQQLLKTSYLLLGPENHLSELPDYGCVIFPAAKAYEGVIKKYLLDAQLITNETYQDRRFRVGRALNPDVRPSNQDEKWLYDDLQENCGAELARQIWETWLECRNHVFHFFPDAQEIISLAEAQQKVTTITATIEALIGCNHQPPQSENNNQ